MAVPPPDPWYRRYYGYYRRPYSGCGCLYSIMVVLLVWFVLSLFINSMALFW